MEEPDNLVNNLVNKPN